MRLRTRLWRVPPRERSEHRGRSCCEPICKPPPIVKKNAQLPSTEVRATQQSPRYLAKKQHRYAYDSDVYVKIFLLMTVLHLLMWTVIKISSSGRKKKTLACNLQSLFKSKIKNMIIGHSKFTIFHKIVSFHGRLGYQ